MTDRPACEAASANPGDPPTVAAAPADPSAITQTIAPSGDTVSPDAAPGLPDLSVGPGTSAGVSRTAPEPPKLDGYQVIDAIGQGGMGTVWRGVQLSTRRNVALKLISAAGFASERARQRFDREVEITARLEHPNIARVYDSGINHGVYFYAMELIDGKPLDQYVAGRKLNRRQILELFAIVCRGVDHAHERGVIHRDLKPGNILVSADGQPHVLDFGLAKALMQVGKEAGISIDGDVAGTPGFMSPEQAAGKLDIDARCDVYSLGVILYRLLTGGAPHDLSGTYLDILRRVSEEEPKRPRLADKTIDRDLEALLLHAIERSASQRYKTAGDLARDIENYLAGDPVSAKPATTIYFLQKRLRKHRVKLTTAGTVLLLAGAALSLSGRLLHSHHDVMEETRKKNEQTALAVTEARAKEIATANNSVLSGDKSLAGARWDEARQAYQSAASLLQQAGVSTTRADLGLWDVDRQAPQPVAVLTPAGRKITAAPHFDRSGREAVVGYDDGETDLLELATGEVLQLASDGHRAVRSVDVFPDAKRLVSATDDGQINVWDHAIEGDRNVSFSNGVNPIEGGRITHVKVSPDGRYAASVLAMTTPDALSSPTYNDTLTVWDAVTGRPLLTSKVEAGVLAVSKTVTQIAFSPDSASLVTASASVDVWRISNGTSLAHFPGSATSVAYSPDGNSVVAGKSDGTIRLFNLIDGKVSTPPSAGSAISAIGFDSTGQRIVMVSEDGAARAVALDGTVLWSQPPRGDVDSATLSADGSIAVTVAGDSVSVWRLSPPPEAKEISRGGPFPGVLLSADGRLLLARSARRGMFTGGSSGGPLFDVATGKTLDISPVKFDNSEAVAFSRDGRRMAGVSGSTITIVSLDPPHEVCRLQIARSAAADAPILAFNHDGTQLGVGLGSTLSVYRVDDSARPPLEIKGHSPITAITFSDDGRTVVVGREQQAEAWDVNTGTRLALLDGHGAAVNAVAVSDDGRFAVTGCGAARFAGANDNAVRLWELPAGKLLKTFASHSARVRSVAISGDGNLIASGGDDQSVVFYDRAAGEVIRTIPGSAGAVLSLSFDQAGHQLAVGADTLRLWNFTLSRQRSALSGSHGVIRVALPDYGLDDAAWLELCRWYALQGQYRWASSLYHREDPRRKAALSALELSATDWQGGNLAAAEQDFGQFSAQDAPAYYVKLCKATLHAEKARGEAK